MAALGDGKDGSHVGGMGKKPKGSIQKGQTRGVEKTATQGNEQNRQGAEKGANQGSEQAQGGGH